LGLVTRQGLELGSAAVNNSTASRQIMTHPMHPIPLTRRRLLAHWLALAASIAGSMIALAQDSSTPGMKRRQDRRDDRVDRVQQRDDKAVQRRTDPIGVRGPQRREDHRDLRTDRRTDRRERVN
jgi:hypothetical protein